MGLAIVRKLRARGDQVRSFSRGTYPALERLGAESARGDIADKAAVLRAAGGHVDRMEGGGPLPYGKPGFANPFFVCYAPGVDVKPL